MTALQRLIATVLTPSPRDEDGYSWAVIAIGHVMLGAALQGLLGEAGAALRLVIAILYWLIKERGDLTRGGSLRDGLADTFFVWLGSHYAGPRWWPLVVMLTVCIGALFKERAR